MPLREVNIAPGINKQVTPTGAEGKWIDCDNVRFRYGYPEKIGGWEQTTTDSLVGVTRAMLIWADTTGRRFIGIGTNKGLFVYYDGAFYDISPLGTALTSCTFTSSNGSSTITVNKAAHGLVEGDLFIFSSVTLPGGGATGFNTANFTTNTFQVITATSDNFTVTMASNESGTGMSAAGSVTVTPYFKIGDAFQVAGYGWGTGRWGGETFPLASDTLDGALLNDSAGTGGSGTSITLDSTTNFSSTGGTILVDSELITYTGKAGNDLTGIIRGALGTATSAHSDGTQVIEASTYAGWGDATDQVVTILEPGNWSLDNFGEILIGTVRNNKSFQWDPSASNSLGTRATVISNAPEKSVMTIVSDRDRHLIHLGTEVTIASGVQDKMFIRFSDQESLTDYIPTSTNTAGTFRIDNGSKIVGGVNAGSYNLVLTDTSAYSIRFIGPPFTFGIEQVGSNCGLISQHGIVAVNGVVYWMGQAGGFYLYDGTVKKIACSVEDFVFTTIDDGDLGLNFDASDVIFAGYNSLFGEINWFYPSASTNQIDRVVTYNYLEGVWTIGSLDRTTYYDKTVYDNPYATQFDETGTPSFPTIQGVTNVNGSSILYAHEKGNNQVNNTATTAIVGSIQSGDFEIDDPKLGTGEFFIKVRRFIPDFRALSGNARITINLKDFPSDTESSSSLGPFTVSKSTQKIDTRARARAANLKIENTARDESWRYGTFKADTQLDGRR
tara:strand:+ start:569 stop:2743 length:2175 start_codon:yes stop_codon:yes gene_type:complete